MKKKPIAKHVFEGVGRNQLKITGGTEFDGDWIRKEDPKHIRRITLAEAARMPFEEVLAACQYGSRKLVLEFPIVCHADVARLGTMVTSWEWTTKQRLK